MDRPRSRLVLAALLGLATLCLYAQVAGHAFLHFDDGEYVTNNPVVRAGLTWRGVVWAATALEVANWHPLTWLSHMTDVELFGLWPGAHHLVGALLHAVNAALLFLVLAAMTGAPKRSLFVAALFAVHPLHVESVAWISERKDVLSTLFGLLALLAYRRHAERPGAGRYALVVAAFAASLASKPMLVTLPFLLLLLDLWPLQRIEGTPLARDPDCPSFPVRPLRVVVLEKLPLVVLSAAASAIAVVAQRRGGALQGLALDVTARVSNAVVSYARYLGKTFWPERLAVFYPRAELSGWEIAGAALLLATITGLVLWRGRRLPWLALGWLWFLGTLVPVIGLVQVGSQAMADRYTYLPLVGIFVVVAWGATRLAGAWARGVPLRICAGAVVAVLAVATWRQTAYWSDHVTLFRRAIAVTGANPAARFCLSQGLATSGALPEALVHAREAVRLDPGNPRAHKNAGYVLYRLGLLDESIDAFRAAIALDPAYAEAHGNLAIAYGRKGWMQQASQEMALEARLRARPR